MPYAIVLKFKDDTVELPETIVNAHPMFKLVRTHFPNDNSHLDLDFQYAHVRTVLCADPTPTTIHEILFCDYTGALTTERLEDVCARYRHATLSEFERLTGRAYGTPDDA